MKEEVNNDMDDDRTRERGKRRGAMSDHGAMAEHGDIDKQTKVR